jgi:two-component system nitrate/nitrite response regulator NarL
VHHDWGALMQQQLDDRARPGSGARIVLCDDHQLFAQSFALILELRDHQVVAVTRTPLEAVAAVVAHDADLCIMDLAFPGSGGSGVEGARSVLQARPGTAVVILSAERDARAFERAAGAGVTGFASKDQDVDDVLETLERVLAGQVVGPALLRQAMSSQRRPLSDVERLASYLTAREREVLGLLTQGLPTESIAASMGVAYSTARTHIQNVLAKLGVHSRLEASALAVANNLHRAV